MYILIFFGIIVNNENGAQLDALTYHDQLKFYWSCWDYKSRLNRVPTCKWLHMYFPVGVHFSMGLALITHYETTLMCFNFQSWNTWKCPVTVCTADTADVDEKWNRQLIECELIVKQSIFRHHRIVHCTTYYLVGIRYSYLMSIDLRKHTHTHTHCTYTCKVLEGVGLQQYKKISIHRYRSGYYICYIVVCDDFVRVYGWSFVVRVKI